uniref:WD40 repeat n=1 Tax=Candidatus Kentrum eta TaxID=2126337 RepID=A0A450UHZ1_9GAMM|nr:MAG: WD40 repeat [Candidatus Kentron sp. H]
MTRCPACFRQSAAHGTNAAPGTDACHCGWRADQAPVGNSRFLPLGTPLGESYVIGRVLGHGGLGVTYLAWDSGLDTRLAIKEFLPEGLAGRDPGTGHVLAHTGQEPLFQHALDRFREEAKTLARFQQYPGIVSVYRFLSANGTGYMAMEFVDGKTLGDHLAECGGRLDWRGAWALLTPVMDTLRQVHGAGLLHRDIAPDNLYLTFDNQVKLLDFGAAREIAGGGGAPRSLLPTKGPYAPEEQYRTRGEQGAWTDIYGLCATLYQCITGRLPDSAPDRGYADTLQPPAKLGVDISQAHQAVLMKGLALRAEDRWRTIGEMQRAWEKAEAAERPPVPLPEPPPSLPNMQAPGPWPPPNGKNDKLIRYGLWIAFLTLVFTILGVLITALMFINDPADRLTSPEDDQTMGTTPDGVFAHPTTPDYANWRELQRIQAHLGGSEGAICLDDCIRFSPDGSRVLTGSWDDTLKLWAVTGGRIGEAPIRTFKGHTSDVDAVAFSPDGRRVLSGNDDNTLRLWDAASGERLRTFKGHSGWVLSVAFSPDGQTVLSGNADRTLRLWDAASGERLRTFKGHYGLVLSVAFSPDGRRVLSGSWDHTLRLWDAASGEEIRTFRGHSGWVRSVAFSPDGRRVLSGSSDKTLRLWDAARGEEIRTLQGHSNPVRSVAFAPDGQRAVSGDSGGVMILWGAE